MWTDYAQVGHPDGASRALRRLDKSEGPFLLKTDTILKRVVSCLLRSSQGSERDPPAAGRVAAGRSAEWRVERI